MSLQVTQLAWDCAPGDTVIRVNDPRGILAGHKVQMDSEYCRVAQGYQLGTSIVPVLRGQDATVTTGHVAQAAVVFGDAVTDFALKPAAGLVSDRPGAVPLAPTFEMEYWFQGWSPDRLNVPLPTTVGLTLVHLMWVAGGASYRLAAPTADLTGALLLLFTDQWPVAVDIENLQWGPRVVTRTLKSSAAALLLAHTDNTPMPIWIEVTSQLA